MKKYILPLLKVKLLKLKLLLLLGMGLLIYGPARAGKVLQVQGRVVTMEIYPGEVLKPGDIVFTMEGESKKSYGKVTQVQGNKAIMNLVKGNPQVKQITLKRDVNGAVTSGKSTGNSKVAGTGGNLMGVIGAFTSDSLTIKSVSPSISLSGSSNEVSFFMDRRVHPQLQLRLMGLYKMFNVKSSEICSDGGCKVSVNYLGAKAVAIYSFGLPFVGLGFEYLYPMSKSSNILPTGNISSANTYSLEAGYNFKINKGYVPVWFTYSSFLGLTGVDASSLRLGVGYAWPH